MRNKDLVPVLSQRPFTFMRRLTDDLDRMFDELNLRRQAIAPEMPAFDWAPAIELVVKEGVFFVRAELPGLTKEDVKIEVTGNILSLTGREKVRERGEGEGIPEDRAVLRKLLP